MVENLSQCVGIARKLSAPSCKEGLNHVCPTHSGFQGPINALPREGVECKSGVSHGDPVVAV